MATAISTTLTHTSTVLPHEISILKEPTGEVWHRDLEVLWLKAEVKWYPGPTHHTPISNTHTHTCKLSTFKIPKCYFISDLSSRIRLCCFSFNYTLRVLAPADDMWLQSYWHLVPILHYRLIQRQILILYLSSYCYCCYLSNAMQQQAQATVIKDKNWNV